MTIESREVHPGIRADRNRSLRIVADENIPYVKEFFSDFGEITTLPGRSMTAKDIQHADVLLVRSVTRVDSQLLEGSRVGFVGTCTIGVDHLDLDYLARTGIIHSSAPGCNANSVVEYVFSVLSHLRPDWLQRSFGIIGCGNVGGALYGKLKALGLNVNFYDPLLNLTSHEEYRDLDDQVSLEQVLAADVIAMHAPLTRTGAHPSYHLLGADQLSLLKQGALLINAGRGPVIDNSALKRILLERNDIDVALDVWELEPFVDPQLLPDIAMATPHIAGYSFDGKVEGTAMIYRALCDYLKVPAQKTAQQLLPQEYKVLDNLSGSAQQILNQAIRYGYDVAIDDQSMREQLQRAARDSDTTSLQTVFSEVFDGLRKNYRVRREFFTTEVRLANGAVSGSEPRLQAMLDELGFSAPGK